MAQDGPITRSVFEQLAREQLVDPAWADMVTEALAEQPTPWFVRGMVGAGAWLAAILLIIDSDSLMGWPKCSSAMWGLRIMGSNPLSLALGKKIFPHNPDMLK